MAAQEHLATARRDWSAVVLLRATSVANSASPPSAFGRAAPRSMHASKSLPALPHHLSGGRESASRGQWNEQVARLQTPALAATKLSPSHARERDRRGIRSSSDLHGI